MVNKKQTQVDYLLIIAIGGLLLFGIIIIASISPAFSLQKFGTTYGFLFRQLVIGILPGIILGFVLFHSNLDNLRKYSFSILLANLILALMVFLPKIGLSTGGATRWINISGNVTFQPSEFLKLTFILYLASLMATRMEKIKHQQQFAKTSYVLIPFLIVLGVITLILIMQPDISTLVIIAISTLIVYFSLNTPLWHIILMVSGGFITLIMLIKVAPYRLQRLLAFLNPDIDPLGISYQIKQSLIAIGSGGLWGLGFGMSRQKFGFLPQPLTDAVFSIFSEESGFIGASILILLFLLIFLRASVIAKKVQGNTFIAALALGIGSWFTMQAFFNISSMIGILPLSGIPLPFISYGGSHINAELAAAGLLLNTSKSVR